VLRYLQAQRDAGVDTAFERVTVLSRNPARFLQTHAEFAELAWLRFHRGDVEQLDCLPRREGFTHILHAATDSTDAARLTPLQRHDQIVQGTRNMLRFAADEKIARFLLTSSGAVYGPQPPELPALREDFNAMPEPLSAANTYGVAKREAEHLCALYGEQFGIECVIARCFAFVGQDLPRDAHFAIGNFIRDALAGREIRVNGDGSPVRSYMDQAELARWLLALLERGQAGSAYNVGSSDQVTIAELARLVRDTLAPEQRVTLLVQPGADNAGRNRYVPDISKAHAELGLENRIGLAQAIERAANPTHSMNS
jgi:dTDP-glucose 4,6-dehydratase